MKTLLIVYFVAINVVSVVVTASDKYVASHTSHDKYAPRVPERTLLMLSVLGGSVSMFITMKIIRHKTKKPKFMVGIPIIIIIQAAAVFLILKYAVGI